MRGPAENTNTPGILCRTQVPGVYEAADITSAERLTHGSTRSFRSYTVDGASAGAVPVRCIAGKLSPTVPSLCAASGRHIPRVGRARRARARGHPARAGLSDGYIFLCLRLYSERGFMTSRQSRSPRSSAMIRTSAVAILVATGMLYISHIRCSSLPVSS